MTLTMYHPVLMMLLDILTGNLALVDAPSSVNPADLVNNILTQDGSYLLTQDGSYLLLQG
jgi:hypothetical protein